MATRARWAPRGWGGGASPTSPGAAGAAPGRRQQPEPGALLRADSRAGTGKNARAFFREVNKVRECGRDPVYLTPAPQGTQSRSRTTRWNGTSRALGQGAQG